MFTMKYNSLKQILGLEYYHCPKCGKKSNLTGNDLQIYGDYYSLGTGKLKNTQGQIKLRKCCNDCRINFFKSISKNNTKINIKNDKFNKDVDDLFNKCLWNVIPSPPNNYPLLRNNIK